jgi:hypothetical protein
MMSRIRSKIVKRLHELSWLHVPVSTARFRSRRMAATARRLTWLGPGFVFDPRTGRIQAI